MCQESRVDPFARKLFLFAVGRCFAATQSGGQPSLPQTAPQPQPAQPLVLPDQPTDAEIFAVHVFNEPLVPAGGKSTPAGNAALARTIAQYAKAPLDKRPAVFAQFLDANPASPWRLALLVNLGLLYRDAGLQSKALDAFEQAWAAGKGETENRAKVLADLALGYLMESNARIGRYERLKALSAEIKERGLRGPGVEKVAGAREGLWLMENMPERGLRCGAMSLGRILASSGKPRTKEQAEMLETAYSSKKGMTMAGLEKLSADLGMNYRMAKRAPGSGVVAPSVMNLKVGHYAAIIRQQGSRFLVQDPSAPKDTWLDSQTIDSESTGYFLIPPGNLPQGWAPVSGEEGGKIWGRGVCTTHAPQPPPGLTPPNVPPPTIHNPPCPGMAAYDIDLNRVNLLMEDTPLSYRPPVGPEVKFTVNYCQSGAGQANSNYSNMGPQWSFGWSCMIQAQWKPMDVCDYEWIQIPSESGTWYNVLIDETTYSILTSIDGYGPGRGMLSYPSINPAAGTISGGQIGGSYDTWWGYRQFLDNGTEGGIIWTYLGPPKPTSYTKNLPDGSVQVFGLSPDGDNTFLLTQAIDPQGRTLTYNYDSSYRLASVTDAVGQITTLSYEDPGNIYHVTKVTDPFGRCATFQYNAAGQLSGITDTAGMTSQFVYSADGSGFITALTTPYGTTSFANGNDGNQTWLEATDPEGGTERVEYDIDVSKIVWNYPTQWSNDVFPAGMNCEQYCYQFRNSYYWDKNAMAQDPYDYKSARLTHWLHMSPDNEIVSDVPASTKAPLENPVFYNYAGQINNCKYIGTGNQPTVVGQVLDNGHSQIYQYAYNSAGNVTWSGDPAGRCVTYVYDSNNGIDLMEVDQARNGNDDILAKFTYNALHQPLSATDASGQTTQFGYTQDGLSLLSSATNPKGETTNFGYALNPNLAYSGGQSPAPVAAYLSTITGPTGAVTQLGYDTCGRLASVTDPDSYTTSFAYDGTSTQTLNRLAQINDPDGTTEQIFYQYLDPQWTKDRLGRWTHRFYDSLRHLVAVQDPMGRITNYQWCTCGNLESITDANGNLTTWFHDIQGRVTDKVFADGRDIHYAYENTTSRLYSMADPQGQVTTYTYNDDSTLWQVAYSNAVHPTANLSYTYDPDYKRVKTVSNGADTVTYRYNPVAAGTLGSGRIAGIDVASTSGAATYSVNYTTTGGAPGYDQLGRVVSRQIDQNNTVTTSYDALGRVNGVTNPLSSGSFGYFYVSADGRLDHVTLPNGELIQFSYYPNMGDKRLQQITNLDPQSNVISQFGYGYNSVGDITNWTQSNSGTPAQRGYVLGYDGIDELTKATLTGTGTLNLHFDYDPAGNRVSKQVNDTATGFGYNSLNQLTSEGAGGLTHFVGTVDQPAVVTVAGSAAAVDALGNFDGTALLGAGTNSVVISATNGNGLATTQTYQVVVAGGSNSFGYDANGNLINDGTNTYEWDAANRLTAINYASTGNRTEFGYDPLGRRSQIVEKTNGTVASQKNFVWCGLALCEERDSNNNVTRRFYPQGEQIAGVGYFYARDHLGSVRELTDSNGAVQARYNYDLWGNRSANLVTGTGAVESEVGFTGHYFHASSGLHLAPFRAYSSSMGRWISRDPLGEAGGLNLYGYVGNNPIDTIDPSGTIGLPAAAAILAVGAVVVAEGSFYAQKAMLPGSDIDAASASNKAAMAHLQDVINSNGETQIYDGSVTRGGMLGATMDTKNCPGQKSRNLFESLRNVGGWDSAGDEAAARSLYKLYGDNDDNASPDARTIVAQALLKRLQAFQKFLGR